MSKPKVSVSQINIIAKNYDATLRFYRMVGLDIPEPINQLAGALHAVHPIVTYRSSPLSFRRAL